MARIEFAPEVSEDFDRILEHLLEHDAVDAPARLEEIVLAIDVLEKNPLIGRPVGSDRRELIVGRDARGYTALYRYIPEIEAVIVLAIRNQREAGHAQRSLPD